ncbi:MAG: DMT family transporter [Clostridiaceae bacterium]|nr:DMT family transporter [Eubacteriales bacterium]
MPGYFLGEIYAVGVALCDAVGCSAFSHAEEKISVFTVNFSKSFIAFTFLFFLRLILTGTASLAGIGADVWVLALVSGLIGFVFADMCYFSSFVYLPLRVAMVIYYCNPIVAAILAFFFFGQKLTWLQAGGILITLIGVLSVLMVRKSGATDEGQKKVLFKGVLLAALGMLGQAVGVILSMEALRRMPAGISPIVYTQIRQLSAIGAFLLIAAARSKWRSVYTELRVKSVLPLITLGSVTGCALGTTLLLLSIKLIPIGIASAITSISPIFILFAAYVLKKEKIGTLEAVGIVTAVAGIVMQSL